MEKIWLPQPSFGNDKAISTNHTSIKIRISTGNFLNHLQNLVDYNGKNYLFVNKG